MQSLGADLWALNNLGPGRPHLVVNDRLETVAEITRPARADGGDSDPVVSVHLESGASAWLSWPSLYIGEEEGDWAHHVTFGADDGHAGSDCVFSSDGELLWVVAPRLDDEDEQAGYWLWRVVVSSGDAEAVAEIPVDEGWFRIWLSEHAVTVAVDEGQNSNGWYYLDLERQDELVRVPFAGPVHDVRPDLGLVLAGWGPLAVFEWPSGDELDVAAGTSAAVAGAFFLDDSAAVIAGDELFTLSSIEVAPRSQRLALEGGPWVYLAHAPGRLLARSAEFNQLAIFDLDRLAPPNHVIGIDRRRGRSSRPEAASPPAAAQKQARQNSYEQSAVLEIVCPNGHSFEKVFQLSLHGGIVFRLEFWNCPACRAESNVRRGMYTAIDGRLIWQDGFTG